MPKASVTRFIERDKKTLIDFVLDIEKYPEFIPFCIDSKVYEKKEKKDSINIIADLTIGKRPFTDTYKSDVRFDKINDHIHVTNIDGPLNYLETVSYTHLRAHETVVYLVCRLLLEKNLFLMIRRPPRSTPGHSSAASDVYKRQMLDLIK